MQYVMALDAGSGSCRSIIFRTDGTEIGYGAREWLHAGIPEITGSQVFDTKNNWKVICESIREALEKTGMRPSEIAAVSATSMRFGSVLYDGQGNELWAAPNTDARSTGQVTAALKKGYFEKFYKTTGDGFTLCDLMRWIWVRDNHPEIWPQVKHFTMISDWMLYKLTGEFVSDPSTAACSGLFDITKGIWSEEIAALFSIPLEICPTIHASGTVIGKILRSASEQTGLASGTPVVIGGGDTMAGLIGTGHVEKGVSAVIGGTHWQQTFLSDRPAVDPQNRIRVSPHMVPNLWMLETNAPFIGLTMRWFRDTFCEPEKQLAKDMGIDPYLLMEKTAEKAPVGSNGLMALFANLFNARNWVHGPTAFMQFDVTAPQNFGKREFIRRIEEDAALQSFGNLKNIWNAASFQPKGITDLVFAGGASKGFLWPQILADVMGMRVKVPVVKEATALGAAACAAVGVGIYDDIPEASNAVVKWESAFEPNLRHHQTYLELFDKWRAVYLQAMEMVEKGNLEPLWRVAGT